MKGYGCGCESVGVEGSGCERKRGANECQAISCIQNDVHKMMYRITIYVLFYFTSLAS